MFVDASAIVAILLEEDGAELLSQRLEAASRRLTSPLAIYEAVLAVTRVRARGVKEAESRVAAFLESAGIAIEPVGEGTARSAIDAHDRFGKGRHLARLNLCDCFAYAMAKQHSVPLLYKGDDFSRTDLA